jgi:hypothetical protein
MVVVHVDAPQPVSLEGRASDGDDWEVLCTAPCDRAAPTSYTYRITGAGVRTTNTFHIDPGGRLTLSVDPSSTAGHVGAVFITVVGSAALVPIAVVTAALAGGELLGAILICPFAAAFASQAQQNSAYGNCLGSIGTLFGSAYGQPYVWVPAVAGSVLLTAGIVWLVKTPPSRVTQTTGSAALALPPVLLTDSPPRFEAQRVPAPAVVPLVDLRF